MKKPIISVVVTTYNHEKYIAQTIESILSQKDCPDFEIIVGEDCSTDKTREIVKVYADKYPQIKLMNYDTNQGVQKNLKECFNYCQGEYIAICEGDDYWVDKYKLKKQYEVLDRNKEASMCFSDITLLFEDGSTAGHFSGIRKTLPEIITVKEVLLHKGSPATFSCCMYTAQAVASVPHSYYEIGDAYDLLFNLYVLEQGVAIFLKEACVYYRITSQGLWNRKSEQEKRNDTVAVLASYNKFFNYKHDEYFNAAILLTLGISQATTGTEDEGETIICIENDDDDETKKVHFRELMALELPFPGKRILKISIQGRRKH